MCTCKDETCKAARRTKTVNQILKRALFEVLKDTSVLQDKAGAFCGKPTLEVRKA